MGQMMGSEALLGELYRAREAEEEEEVKWLHCSQVLRHRAFPLSQSR